MDAHIRKKIVDTAQRLMEERGYDLVTMRQIAGELGISVGNLTYHYPKKEDILMEIHDRIIGSFYDQLPAEWRERNGIAGFFAAEYAFHRAIADDASYLRIYRQVINSPALREEYYRHHLELLRTFPIAGADADRFEEAVVAMSALEFHLMETAAFERNFDDAFAKLLRCALVFLGMEDEGIVGRSIELGASIAAPILSQSGARP